MKKFQLAMLLVMMALLAPTASAGLIISTTDRPPDADRPFAGASVFEGQYVFARYTLAAEQTVSLVEINAGLFRDSKQLGFKIYTSFGHNPDVDTPDATGVFTHLKSGSMNNDIAALNVPLAGQTFEVFIVPVPGSGTGGAMGNNNGPLHAGTSTGVFYSGALHSGTDGYYIALYGTDVRPTPEPSTFLLAAIGGLTFFVAKRRPRR